MKFLKKNKLFILIILLFLTLRLVNIGTDITNSDSIRWHRRSVKFLTALKQKEYESTYQHYQPGVTLMWLNSVVKQGSYKYQTNFTDKLMTLENSDYFPVIHGISKTLMVLVLAALLSTQLYAIKTLFTEKTALFYGLFMATEPFLIGIDRWFHLTSFEAYFAFTAFLVLLLWEKSNNERLLYASAILFTLAVYSKLTAVVVSLPMLIVFLRRAKKTRVKNFISFVLVSLSMFFVLLPALWVEPQMVLTKFYNAVVNAVGNDVRVNQLNAVNPAFFYPLVISFKLSVIPLFTLFYFKQSLKSKSGKDILTYLLVYGAALFLADKKIDRYAIALFPPLLLVPSVYLASDKFKHQVPITFIILILSFLAISSYHPVYSAYYSPLYRSAGFSSAGRALRYGVFENSGEYFAQAAQYLNQKDGKNLVAIPNNIDSFAFNYKGNVTGDVLEDVDYIVWSHDIDRPFAPRYENCPKLEKTFGANGFDYVYIYSCK